MFVWSWKSWHDFWRAERGWFSPFVPVSLCPGAAGTCEPLPGRLQGAGTGIALCKALCKALCTLAQQGEQDGQHSGTPQLRASDNCWSLDLCQLNCCELHFNTPQPPSLEDLLHLGHLASFSELNFTMLPEKGLEFVHKPRDVCWAKLWYPNCPCMTRSSVGLLLIKAAPVITRGKQNKTPKQTHKTEKIYSLAHAGTGGESKAGSQLVSSSVLYFHPRMGNTTLLHTSRQCAHSPCQLIYSCCFWVCLLLGQS